ncbi:MAG: hypothetical protein NTW23_06420 [Rhodoluna sp.]|nr:hypothetical protein [Rhodoluna sp.]
MNSQSEVIETKSSLPIWALVLGILLPPVGAIMGHIVLSSMRKGEISSVNRNFAVAAVTVGWILTGLLLAAFFLVQLLVWGLQSFFGSLTFN